MTQETEYRKYINEKQKKVINSFDKMYKKYKGKYSLSRICESVASLYGLTRVGVVYILRTNNKYPNGNHIN